MSTFISSYVCQNKCLFALAKTSIFKLVNILLQLSANSTTTLVLGHLINLML